MRSQPDNAAWVRWMKSALILFQLALSSQLSQQTETNASGTSTKIQEPTEQTEYSSLPTTWFAVGCPLSGQGIEVTQTTDALVNLLDESTERMLKEAAKYWCGVQCSSFDISNAGIDESVKGGVEAMSFQRPLAEYEGLTEGMENLEKYPPAARFTHTVKPPATEIAKFPDATSEQPNARLPQNGQSPSETEISNEREQPRLGYLGLSSPGAFRVAWSEMPEVLNSDALKLLTKHEIQLQEVSSKV
ncbi:unnamed protein product [Dicrocoelium dendriticum]|nr:unnamed protein product [Dicrocoelium dendriticum]